MKINFRNIFAALALTLSSIAGYAVDLPTTTVAGQKCYYYDVKPKETIYTIVNQLGISRSEIIRYNPAVVDGIRPGTRLYFPVSDFDGKLTPATDSEEKPPAVAETAAQATSVEKPVKETPAIDVAADDTANDVAPVAQEELTSTVAHKVKRGESLYGISRNYGLTMEQLIAYNPRCANGVRPGDILVIPVAGGSDESTGSNKPSEDTPDYSATSRPATQDDAETPGYTASYETPDPLNMAIILPFMLSEEEPSKTAQIYTEFYKGFLLAADSLKENGNTPVNIYVFDSAASTDTVAAIISRPEFDSMNLIIAPDNEEQLATIVNGVSENTYIVNPFIVKNDFFIGHRNIMQVNIPHADMYEKAIRGIREIYPAYTPVFLSRIDGAADKDAFITALKENLDRDSVEYIDITFRNLLTDNDLSQLTDDRDYIFIPVSGNRSEFAKITTAVKRFRDEAITNRAVLFGYPEWITFRGDYHTRLCDLNATIYTRWYADMTADAAENFVDRFKNTYGEELLDAVPKQGLLGFDLGFFLINALRDSNGDMHADTLPYYGLQSNFNFSDDNVSGLVNNALMFVTFGNNGSVSKINL